MNLPRLYKKTSTGAIQQWEISVAAYAFAGTVNEPWAVIRTRYGQIDGKVQEAEDVIKSGKNTGKKNATTAVEQAALEAQAKWEKQLKKGYVKTVEEAQAGKVDEIIEGGVAPMLAHRFDEQGHKIVYPAYAQPKFDGHRCIATIDDDGKAHLWSRTRKPITGLPHINKALEKLAVDTGNIGPFDGELYNHAYKENFEELSSFIRNEDPQPGHEAVQYHIYDVALNDSPFVDRHCKLSAFSLRSPYLVAVETVAVADEDELMLAFERFLTEGYEGLMVRNFKGLYVNKRSYDLQKVKEFQDAEYLIIGAEEGRGKMAGKAIFVCKTADGAQFRVKMKGSLDSLKKFIDNPDFVVGKYLTVQYQGITNKSQVPRFPVGLRIREDL